MRRFLVRIHDATPALPDYCRRVREGSEERLLHGYFHRLTEAGDRPQSPSE